MFSYSPYQLDFLHIMYNRIYGSNIYLVLALLRDSLRQPKKDTVLVFVCMCVKEEM